MSPETQGRGIDPFDIKFITSREYDAEPLFSSYLFQTGVAITTGKKPIFKTLADQDGQGYTGAFGPMTSAGTNMQVTGQLPNEWGFIIKAIGVAVGRGASADDTLILNVEQALRVITLNLKIQQALEFNLGPCRNWPGGQGIDTAMISTNAANELAVINNGRPTMKSIRSLNQVIALTPGNSFECWYDVTEGFTPSVSFSLDTFFYGRKVSRSSV